MRGTNEGPFFGSGPTQRMIASHGLSLHRVVDGRIAEDWEFNDDMGLMRGLGFRVVPPDPAEAEAAE
jgi:predicted ester cyclase